MLKQPRFARLVTQKIHLRWPRAVVQPLAREGAWGAVALARRYLETQPTSQQEDAHALSPARDRAGATQPSHKSAAIEAARGSPTERRNPRSMNLDRLPLSEAIALMLREDARIPRALLREQKPIGLAVKLIVRALRRGGRLLYVGAGTSGRLGVLDAAECPPTFSTPPEMV